MLLVERVVIIKSIDELFEEILDDVNSRKTVDYGSRMSVKRYNMAYDRAFKNIQRVDKHHPDQLPQLIVLLLTHPDHHVVGTCAPMIFRLENSTREQKMEAISAIRSLINDPRVDSLDRLGFSMSLKAWEHEILGD